jgi:hypothetical protein
MSRNHRFLQPFLACWVFFTWAVAFQESASCYWDSKDARFRAGNNVCHLYDDTKPPSWPWTHRPYCICAGAAADVKYCIYTSATHGGNGLSLVTSPELAADVVQLLDKSYEPPRLGGLAPSYDVVDIPDKGKGVVANAFIPALGVIMIDSAAVMVDHRLAASVDEASLRDLRHRAVQQLRNPASILGLSIGKTSHTDLASAVLMTNSFTFDLQGAPHGALFPDVAVSCAGIAARTSLTHDPEQRLNHACNPKSVHATDRPRLAAARY